MTETSISLLAIFIGILAAILTGVISNQSLGLTGNAIAGVFGSILFTKLVARIGIDPVSIMETGTANTKLLSLHLMTSILGGYLAVVLAHKIKRKYGKQ